MAWTYGDPAVCFEAVGVSVSCIPLQNCSPPVRTFMIDSLISFTLHLGWLGSAGECNFVNQSFTGRVNVVLSGGLVNIAWESTWCAGQTEQHMFSPQVAPALGNAHGEGGVSKKPCSTEHADGISELTLRRGH